MQISEKTLELALIKASSIAKCSIVDLEYKVIQNPSKGFLGFFKKDAIIEFKEKDNISEELLTKIQQDLELAFKKDYFSVKQIIIKSINECSISVEFICDNYELFLGKDLHKYKYLDILVSHLVNTKYNLYTRVLVQDYLNEHIRELNIHLNDVKNKLKDYSKANTKPLEPTLLNIAYSTLLKDLENKHIVIKDSSAGKYIMIYENNK